MAIALRGTGSSANLTASSYTLPFTTLTNDMIVVVVGTQNANWSNGSSTLPNNTTVTFSGAGATWTSFALNSSTANGYAVWIGYGCTAGATTITRSGSPATSVNGQYAFAQFSGVAATNAIASYSPIISNATSNSTATTTVSYSAGQLLLGTAESFTWASTTGTWNGVADSLAVTVGSARIPLIDYLIAPSTQSGVAYVSPRSASGQPMTAAQAFVINAQTTNSGFMSFM